MKKLALVLAAATAAAICVMGANCSGGAKSCTTDADCTDATDPVCDVGSTNVCIPAACTVGDTGDAQCRVDDAGGSASCTADGDCTTAGDKCLKGSNDTGHCVTPEDPATPCSGQGGGIEEQTGEDIAGGSVNFCDTSTAKCDAPGKCSGVSG